jgi:hypothetical protein
MSALITCAVSGQQLFDRGGFFTDPDGVVHATFASFHGLPPVPGAPYSADVVVEHAGQSAPSQHVARDSEGRVRIERSMLPSGEGVPTLVQIFDPVAGFDYILDDQNKVAHRIAVRTVRQDSPGGSEDARRMPVGDTGITASAQVIHPNQPRRSVEQLGTRTIEGVPAEGTRRTTVWPDGRTDVSETWYSQELKAMVLSKTSNARGGDSAVKLTKLSRANPDALLFRPPADYKVVDAADSVTLNLKRP